MERILLMLPSGSAKAAYETLAQAVDSACYPQRLSLAVGLKTEWEPEAIQRFKGLGTFSFCSLGAAEAPLAGLFAHWRGEEYGLVLPEGAAFDRHWDLQLVTAYLRLRRERAFLTGYLSRPQDPFGPMPVAAQGFDEDGRLCFQPGMPLCCCANAPKCAFLHPDFIFGPATLFKALGEKGDRPLFLKAFEAGFAAHTLPVPALRHPHMPAVPEADFSPWAPWEAESPWGRFERQFAVELSARRLSSAARLGLYTPDLQYDMRIPPEVIWKAGWRRLRLRRQRPTPLFVTAYREMACPVKHLTGEYETWFRNLARLRELPLLLYAKGGTARRVRSYFSNIYEYQQRYGLPLERIWTPEEDLRQFKAGKPFLLARTMATLPHHSHYAWIDFGCQRWPLYAKTAFDWRGLCDEQIHIGRVNGKLDTSCFIVPHELVPFLCEEMTRQVLESLAAGVLPGDDELMAAIAGRAPRQFIIHELPEPRSLLRLSWA